MAQLIITTPQLSLGSAEDRFLHDPHAPYPRNINNNNNDDNNNNHHNENGQHVPYPVEAQPYDPVGGNREGAELRGRNGAAAGHRGASGAALRASLLIFCLLCIELFSCDFSPVRWRPSRSSLSSSFYAMFSR